MNDFYKLFFFYMCIKLANIFANFILKLLNYFEKNEETFDETMQGSYSTFDDFDPEVYV